MISYSSGQKNKVR